MIGDVRIRTMDFLNWGFKLVEGVMRELAIGTFSIILKNKSGVG
jgi:hypothetical protein